MDREVAIMAGAERNSGMSKIRRYRNDVGALRREVKKSVRIGNCHMTTQIEIADSAMMLYLTRSNACIVKDSSTICELQVLMEDLEHMKRCKYIL